MILTLRCFQKGKNMIINMFQKNTKFGDSFESKKQNLSLCEIM